MQQGFEKCQENRVYSLINEAKTSIYISKLIKVTKIEHILIGKLLLLKDKLNLVFFPLRVINKKKKFNLV